MVVVPLAAGRDELFGELRVLTFVGTCTVHAVLVHWLSPEGAKCGQWVSRSKARNGLIYYVTSGSNVMCHVH